MILGVRLIEKVQNQRASTFVWRHVQELRFTPILIGKVLLCIIFCLPCFTCIFKRSIKSFCPFILNWKQYPVTFLPLLSRVFTLYKVINNLLGGWLLLCDQIAWIGNALRREAISVFSCHYVTSATFTVLFLIIYEHLKQSFLFLSIRRNGQKCKASFTS